MNSSAISSFAVGDSDDSDIAERSPNGRYIRYNEVLAGGQSDLVYKGFDEIGGMEITWNKVGVEDDIVEAEQRVERLNKLLKPLKHENVIKYCCSWVDRRCKVINTITESFSSGNLRQFRRKHKNVDMIAIKNWCRQILRGMCYLHSHSPPIIHGNLRCDNIFVNGNTGEVKIGGLGLANLIQHESFDVFMFGICMIELVTSEFCDAPAEIYDDIITKGKSPVSLEKVKNSQVKQFIEKCLVPTSSRLSAMELLEDPFLQLSSPTVCTGEALVSVFELSKPNRDGEFRLRGERSDSSSISFKLQIVSSRGEVTNIDFVFSLDSDTTTNVAKEMMEELGLSCEDASLIAELMDSLITKIIPCWTPSILGSRDVNSSHRNPILVF